MERSRSSAAAIGAYAALAVLVAMPYAACGDWILGAQAGLRHDNNVGNAQFAPDIVADSTTGARISAFQLIPVGESYSVTVGGDLGGEVFHRFTGLNNASLDGVLAARKKWGLGAYAPWARAGLSVGRSSYDDSYRNAWDYRATLASGRRIDDRWNLWADYAFERRAATPQMEEEPGLSGDAFSQVSHTIAAHVEYALNDSVFLAIGLSARHGDVVSTTTEDNVRAYAVARALAGDPAFGPEAYAYKLTGTSYGYRLGINYSPTAHTLVGCGFERLETRADGGNDYTKSIAEITLDYQF